ncbi:tyrosine-type recombinase/integrase [Stenotrophobium rhamnosiphilum]|uniref:Integrase n=1 Tax=Stenotrophobium rhamnosiphilum TaxID=2029166 RepID=A0A2T5MB71_9GAMM|nr:integrase arm-type DNA-binding domain-containing protein [Stenotrophobium rhamnosiphilum]PTU28232.1 integrase [Stenotrophobium rhamnosiphilum]
MSLTAVQVKNAKPGPRPYKETDERGMYLLVQTSGSKLWRLNYRFGGKSKTLALGAYPDVSLAAAREKRDEARRLLTSGIDPSQAKRAEKAAVRTSTANSFEVVAREWLAKQNLADSTRTKVLWLFESLTFPWIGTRPIKDITAPELLAVLRRVEARGKLHTAQGIKQRCGQVFRYAVATGRAERDPSGDLRGALATPKTRHRASITDPTKIGPLLRAIDGYQGSIVTACALKLAPLLFVRPGELRHAEWSEFDLASAEWRIPAAKMKMRQTHIVPLSMQGIAVLKELNPLTGSSRYVFPSIRSHRDPMSENTVLAALRRMGYSGEEMSGHGFRSMASTRLHEMGWPHAAIERQLAHAERNKVSAAYNYAEHLPERRKMMQAWADYLDVLRDNRNVVEGNFGRVA